MKTVIRTAIGIVLCLGAVDAQGTNKAGLKVPASTPAGGPFQVTWNGAQIKGRLTIVKADGGVLPAASYAYATKKKALNLTAPPTPGSYAVKFAERNDVFALVKFEVTPVTATLNAPPTAEINQAIDVKFTGPAYKQDTIRVAKADGSLLPGGSYAYAAQAGDGVVKLKAPVRDGSYQIVHLMQKVILARSKLRVGGTLAKVQTRKTVQAGGDLEVTWEGPNNKGDLVTIVKAGSQGRVAGASYGYTSQSTARTVLLTAPEELGDYEVVYLTGGKAIARQPVKVAKVSATLNAPGEVVGGLVFPVDWTGPGNRQDQVLVHAPAEKETARAYAYIDAAEARVEIVVRCRRAPTNCATAPARGRCSPPAPSRSRRRPPSPARSACWWTTPGASERAPPWK